MKPKSPWRRPPLQVEHYQLWGLPSRPADRRLVVPVVILSLLPPCHRRARASLKLAWYWNSGTESGRRWRRRTRPRLRRRPQTPLGADLRASVVQSERVSAVPATMVGAGERPIEGGMVGPPVTCLKTQVESGFHSSVGEGRIVGRRAVAPARAEQDRRWHPAWDQGPGTWRRRDNGLLYRSPGPTPDLNDHTTGMSASITCGSPPGVRR